LIVSIVTGGSLLAPSAAFACGGLVAANGAVNLSRTTTLAAYVDGIEHYITAFEFSGLGGAKFGSIVPLPGEPESVKRAGDWTLQRLIQEVTPPIPQPAAIGFGTAASADRAQVILEVEIDALDITVVKGGAASVAEWAIAEGFDLSPDAPEVLEFYAERSPYFMAASFDAKRAADLSQSAGDSTPIHVTIPVEKPWVPLRILALGRKATEPVTADVFLLTEAAPALLPVPVGAGTAAGLPVARGLTIERSQAASSLLLADLRSDKGMKWLPARGMWLTFLKLDGLASEIGYDLAIDASGAGRPSWRAAGFPIGVFGLAQNPVRGPSVRFIDRFVQVPVSSVDRTGWIASSLLLIIVAAVAVFRRRTIG
jgi:hypothetical protein